MHVFGLKPVVLVRNLYDIVISLDDHLLGESDVTAMAYVPRDFATWPSKRRHEFIAKMMMPWYFNFYVSWSDCPDVLMVQYTELVADPLATISRVVAHAGISCTPKMIAAALSTVRARNTRFNVGKSGRGAELPDEVRELVKQQTMYYRDVDFSPLLQS